MTRLIGIHVSYSHQYTELGVCSMLFDKNMKKYIDMLEKEGIECSLIFNSSNIFYLTGYEGSGFIIICHDGVARLYVPLLEYSKAKSSVKNTSVEVKAYSKYPLKGVVVENYVEKDLISIIKLEIEKCKKIGLDKNISLSMYDRISDVLKGKEVIDITKNLSKLRSIKDEAEIEIILKAVNVAEKALKNALDELYEGISELELAGKIEYYMKKYGATTPAFPTIVAFGENSAYPHAIPSSKKLGDKDIILIDIGSRVNGYCSDMTRTFGYRYHSSNFKKHLEAVISAQLEAIDHIAPGIKASDVDRKAREVLEKEGLARYFIHGLGHGVGIEVHESPALSPGSNDVLEKGMVVTVEPGIYIDGLYGIRVEDLVLVTSKGGRVLTSFSKILDL